MKPQTIKAIVTSKVENKNNGQVRLIVENKDKKNPMPEVAITLVFADPKRASEFQIDEKISFNLKSE